MALSIKKYLLLLGLLLPGSACNDKDEDYRGLFHAEIYVDERFTDSMLWNATHTERVILVNSANYHLVITGDSHIGGLDHFKKLLRTVNTVKYDALLLAGDNTTGKKADYDALKYILQINNTVPTHLVVGNHDLFFKGWPTFLDYFGASTYTITVRTPSYSDLYICLDTGGGTLGTLQLAWLKETLKYKRHLNKNCVVLTHCNFLRERSTLTTNPTVEELVVLLDLFAQYEVNFAVTAHDHEKYVDVFGPTTYLSVDAIEDGFPNPTYLEIRSSNGELDYAFVEL